MIEIIIAGFFGFVLGAYAGVFTIALCVVGGRKHKGVKTDDKQ